LNYERRCTGHDAPKHTEANGKCSTEICHSGAITALPHARPNESVDPTEIKHMALAEASFLANYRPKRGPDGQRWRLPEFAAAAYRLCCMALCACVQSG
jgi:hypothetical protein